MCLGDAQDGGLFGDGHQGDAKEDQWKRNEVGISTLASRSLSKPAVLGTSSLFTEVLKLFIHLYCFL